VFEDSLPDFSDLTALSEPDDVDLMGSWHHNELDVSIKPTVDDLLATDVSIKPTVLDLCQPPAARGRDKRPMRDNSHILVSLLKRPKAELDWIATGHYTVFSY